ncbi:hypothetical protein Asi02nite_18460 [Asanoa siamensis]|uniref:Integrase catalytic domain-containing protein n=1 Tax=Asanoa siamensis TaxID=926357 RepID=A0ABQ4CM28_9ACTN|nr:hypothetical protein Asi02nite_18460 [Asanoa siamensis]
MTDNALAYRRGRAWHQALTDLGAQARFTRRYRPQTNGKAERFNRAMCDEWIYARPFTTNRDRADALPHTPTTTTADTPANHPSPASTALLVLTASAVASATHRECRLTATATVTRTAAAANAAQP